MPLISLLSKVTIGPGPHSRAEVRIYNFDFFHINIYKDRYIYSTLYLASYVLGMAGKRLPPNLILLLQVLHLVNGDILPLLVLSICQYD